MSALVSSRSGLSAIPLTGRSDAEVAGQEEGHLRPIFLCLTSRSGMMAPSRAATFDMIRTATCTTAGRKAARNSGTVHGVKHLYIVRASSTAMYARSNRSAVQMNNCA